VSASALTAADRTALKEVVAEKVGNVCGANAASVCASSDVTVIVSRRAVMVSYRVAVYSAAAASIGAHAISLVSNDAMTSAIQAKTTNLASASVTAVRSTTTTPEPKTPAEDAGSAGGDLFLVIIIVVAVVLLFIIAGIACFVLRRQSGNARGDSLATVWKEAEASAEPRKDAPSAPSAPSVQIEMGVQPTSAETRFNDPAMSQINDQVLNAPGAWDWFITHMQTEASTLAEGIYHEFRNRGLRVWLDVKMHERDEAAIREGIMNSAKVLVIITVSYFTRPHCIKELRWARDAGKDIVVCIDVKDKQRIGEILCTAPEDLKSLGNINFIDMNRGDTEYFQVGIKKLLEANPKKLDYELRPAHS